MPTVDVQPELRLPLDGTRVLVVGAFSSLLGQLVAYLERSFAAVTVVPDHTAIHATEADFADLILVTAAPCPTATLNWIGQLRRQPSSDATTIILVDTNAEADHLGTTLSAIDAGADDYVFLDQQIELAMARIAGVYERRRIHEQHHLHELRLEQSVRGANDGLWYCDLRSGRFYLSARGHQLLGDAEHDAEHSRADWMRRIHPEDREHVERNLQRHLLGGTPHFESELRLQHANGTYRWMFCRGLAITSGDNEPSAIAGSLTDITTGKVADPLTSLPNRLLLLDRLQQSIDRWHEDQTSSFAILYIDIDNFKMVNDTLGHDVGDQLLMSVAKRLQQSIRADDSIVARLGGDEFAILMDDVRDLEESEMAAQRILSVMSQPYFFDGREVFACASIGISAPSSHTQTADELLREADTAMYEAKAEGKSRCRVFHPSMRDALTQRLRLQNLLRHAIERSDLELHYQPIVELRTGRLVGFEALTRWSPPELGTVSPAEFIPIAEETGLVVPLGRWVFEEACRHYSEWREEFPAASQLQVSVNVSSRQLMEREMMEHISQVVAQYKITPSQLKVEVTESAIMDNMDEAAAILQQLRDLGVRVGVDDFGTGYSSLACLYRLPLDLLKVDQSFVHGMLESDEHHAIVQTIITLAQHLHLDVIAEGIESEGQRRELASLACPYGQGYLFSPPVSAEEVKHLLRKHQRSADKHSRLTIYGPAENSQLAESGLGLPTNDPVLLPSDDSRTSHPHGA